MEQRGELNLNLVYEIYEYIFKFVQNTKGPFQAEAMNVLKKLYANKKIRTITETSKVLLSIQIIYNFSFWDMLETVSGEKK